MAIIETKDFSVKQGNKFLIEDVNWRVEPGQHWVVFGANGSGKTTLLSAACGYRSYSTGSLELFDEPATKENIVELRSRIGFVSSSYYDRLFRTDSGFDIALSAKSGGVGRRHDIEDEDVKRVRDIFKALDIQARADYPFELMSQGQRQRILFARALIKTPELLVLDEPLNGLDIIGRDFILNTLQEIAETTDANIVYVTHHVEEILPFYTHALLMRGGKMFKQGPIDEVFTDDVMTEYFEQPATATRINGKVDISIGKELRMDRSIWA